MSESTPPDILSSRSDFHALLVVLVPAVPLVAILFFPEAFEVEGPIPGKVAGALLCLLVGYVLGWIGSRMFAERNFRFRPQGVWLPAYRFRLLGRFVPYGEVESVTLFHHDRRVRISFLDGQRVYDRGFVDAPKLGRTLTAHLERYRPPEVDEP